MMTDRERNQGGGPQQGNSGPMGTNPHEGDGPVKGATARPDGGAEPGGDARPDKTADVDMTEEATRPKADMIAGATHPSPPDLGSGDGLADFGSALVSTTRALSAFCPLMEIKLHYRIIDYTIIDYSL